MNQENDFTNDDNNPPVSKPKDKKICNLPNKKFIIATLRKFNELQQTQKDKSVKSGK